MLDAAAFGIIGAEHQPPDPEQPGRRRAHGAGLQRHPKIAPGQPRLPERRRRRPHSEHLGVRSRIAIRLYPVARPCDHLPVRPRHDGAHRDLAARPRRGRLLQRHQHQRARTLGNAGAAHYEIAMAKHSRPVIGVTLDAEPPGGYSAYPWYALRCNYADAIVQAGGLPIPLSHHADLAPAMLDLIDALVVTGGAFDVDPALYGEGDATHSTVVLKQGRTDAEHALLHGALARDMPILGICGGEQLLAVALGGTLIQHIPDSRPDAFDHEQKNPRHEPGHSVAITPNTLLARITGAAAMQVNSSHHQAVLHPGSALVSALAPDGIIEAIEDPKHRFCLGVQWHPEFHIDPGDARIFAALLAAAA